jgi:hypothetical protein
MEEGKDEKYIITIIYFKIRPPKAHPTLVFYIIKGKGGKERKTCFKYGKRKCCWG